MRSLSSGTSAKPLLGIDQQLRQAIALLEECIELCDVVVLMAGARAPPRTG